MARYGTTYSKPRKTSISIYGGTLPGSPAWYAEQRADKGSPHANYLANLMNPNRPVGQYPTHEAGIYTQAGQPSPTAAAPAAAPQPPYAPQQQPAYAPQQQAGFDYSEITGMFEESMAEANRANEARYQEGLGIYGQIADIYKPGGGFGAGHEAQLERTKTRDVASAQQQMVSSGLWGTTVAAALPSAWEETVGQPSRLALQDVQMGRYGEALAGKAGFVERRSDIGPDMGLFAGLMQGAYAGPMSGGGAGGGVGGEQVGGGQAGGGQPTRAPMPSREEMLHGFWPMGGSGQVGGQRYGTPPAGGGQAPGPGRQIPSISPHLSDYPFPGRPGALPAPHLAPRGQQGGGQIGGASKGKGVRGGGGGGGGSAPMSAMARYATNLRSRTPSGQAAAQSEYKKRQLASGGRSLAGSRPQSSVYGKTASRPGWGRYS